MPPFIRNLGKGGPAWMGLSWAFGGLGLGLTTLCTLASLATIGLVMLVGLLIGLKRPGPETATTQATPPRQIVVVLEPTVTPLPAVALMVPPPPTFTPTAVPPTPTPHPLHGYTIDGLRERAYPGGTLAIRRVLTETATFTRYYIDYPSDGLTITGIMQLPPGDGPFPVIVLNHGYIPRDQYWSGADTWSAAGYFNKQGYLTVAPDFRSWGESDVGNSFFGAGQVIDTLNLLGALQTVPQADPMRIGMWGHSMGGGITLKAVTIDPRIRAAVLYAPTSGDDQAVLDRWGPGCDPTKPAKISVMCGGAEYLVEGIDSDLFHRYVDAVFNPAFLRLTSADNYIAYIEAPIQVHIGRDDRVTPPEWSVDIYEKLAEEGKVVDFFSYPGQGHRLTGPAWLTFMQRSSDFFDQHLNH